MAVIGGLTSNLLTSVLNRTLVPGLQKNKRLNKLADADAATKTRGRPLKFQRDLQQLQNDLAVYLGTIKGEYTESVDNFMQELASSGILADIFEHHLHSYLNAGELANIPCGLRAAILATYEKYFPHAHAQFDEFSDRLNALISTFARATLDERDTQSLLVDISSNLSGKITAVTAALEAQKLETPLDPRRQKQLEERVRSNLRIAYRQVRVPTLHGFTDAEIRDVYVNSKCCLIHPETDGYPARSRDIEDIRFFAFPIDAQSFLGTNRRAVILGDPGGGKSTLAQQISFELIDSEEKQQNPLAIWIKLRSFAIDENVESLNIFENIVRSVCAQANMAVDEIRDLVQNWIMLGRILLVFDGLDEIIDPSNRVQVSRKIGQFADQYPLTSIVITSRLAGYDPRSLNNFNHLVLAPFEPSDVDAYVKKYFQTLARNRITQPRVLSRQTRLFIQRAESHAKEFKDNPLTLSLMLGIFEAHGGNVPDNRARLYEECAIQVFQKWDKERGIYYGALDREDLFALIGKLAAKIYRDPNLTAGFSKGWLHEEVSTFLFEVNTDERWIRATTKEVAEDLTERRWVFVETNDDCFEFTHRTFLEYFFARELRDTYDNDPTKLLEEMFPKIIEGEWFVPVHLALQMMATGGKRQCDRAAGELERLWDAEVSELPTDFEDTALENIAAFCAGACGYLACSAQRFERIVTFCFRVLVRNNRAFEHGGFNPFFATTDSVVGRLEVGARVTANELFDGVQREEPWVFEFIYRVSSLPSGDWFCAFSRQIVEKFESDSFCQNDPVHIGLMWLADARWRERQIDEINATILIRVLVHPYAYVLLPLFLSEIYRRLVSADTNTRALIDALVSFFAYWINERCKIQLRYDYRVFEMFSMMRRWRPDSSVNEVEAHFLKFATTLIISPSYRPLGPIKNSKDYAINLLEVAVGRLPQFGNVKTTPDALRDQIEDFRASFERSEKLCTGLQGIDIEKGQLFELCIERAFGRRTLASGQGVLLEE